MFFRRYLWGGVFGFLVSGAGLVAYLWEGKKFNSLEQASQAGSGYLFLISGLVVVGATLLLFLSEKQDQGSGGQEKRS